MDGWEDERWAVVFLCEDVCAFGGKVHGKCLRGKEMIWEGDDVMMTSRKELISFVNLPANCS